MVEIPVLAATAPEQIAALAADLRATGHDVAPAAVIEALDGWGPGS